MSNVRRAFAACIAVACLSLVLGRSGSAQSNPGNSGGTAPVQNVKGYAQQAMWSFQAADGSSVYGNFSVHESDVRPGQADYGFSSATLVAIVNTPTKVSIIEAAGDIPRTNIKASGGNFTSPGVAVADLS